MVKLSTVVELLVLSLLVAFAASRVIDPIGGIRGLSNDHHHAARGLSHSHHHKTSYRKNRQEVEVPNRFCKCSSLSCNCCRDFSLPVVPIKGPGCAMIRYLSEDKISITMSFGDRVLRNITVNGKSPKPVCMGLPGGISKFCGKVYGINRDGDQFKACLGLELRALDDVEAALRVSCFRFGPQGLNLEPGQPVPVDEEEEDDEDDEYGLGDDDDDDDDDDDFGLGDDDDEEEATANDADNDVDSDESDYTGFSALSEEFLGDFFGSESGTKKKPITKRKDPVQFTNTVISKPVVTPTVNTVQKPTKVQKVKPVRTGTTQAIKKPVRKPTTPTPTVDKTPVDPIVQTPTKPKNPVKEEPVTATAITITVEQGGQKLEDVKKPDVDKKPTLQNDDDKPVIPQGNSKPTEISKRPVLMSKPVVKVEQIQKEPSKDMEKVNEKENASIKNQTVAANPVTKPESGEKIIIETPNKVETMPVKQNITNEDVQSQSINKVIMKAPVQSSSETTKPDVQPIPSTEKDKTKNEGQQEQAQTTTEQFTTGITSVSNQQEIVESQTDSATPAVLSEEGTDKVEAITENINNNNNDDSYEEEDEDIGVSILDDDDEEEEEEDEDTDTTKQESIQTTKEEIIPEIIQPEKKDSDDDDEDDDLLDGILDDEDDEDEEDKERKIEAPIEVNPLLYQLASISVGNTPQARHLPPLSPFYRSSRTHKRMRLPPIEST